ncbi:hypothetical protein SUGI_0079440 [Cryptomeria japonica]|nr:hypothetical protein SUGI_0079440 [Cryptomeria japonica]
MERNCNVFLDCWINSLYGCVHHALPETPIRRRFVEKDSPGFFLFIAAPSSASVAWEAVSGSFDSFSRMLLFLSLFLYLALVVRVDFFRDSIRRFSVIWWSFAYPMTTTSVATLKYAEEVKHPIARTLAYVLTCVSIIVVLILVVLTIGSIVVVRDNLFPNDTLIIPCAEERKKTVLLAKRSRNSCFSQT